jgi:hypothetical protein
MTGREAIETIVRGAAQYFCASTGRADKTALVTLHNTLCNSLAECRDDNEHDMLGALLEIFAEAQQVARTATGANYNEQYEDAILATFAKYDE